jgi:hypothetical protein
MADTFATSLDIKDMDLPGRGAFQFQASFDVGQGIAYQVLVQVDQYKTYVTYSYQNEEWVVIGYGDMFYDAVDSLDLLVQVANGSIRLGINGIEDVQEMPHVVKWSPHFAGMSVGAGSDDPVYGIVKMRTFMLGLRTDYRYYDGLHKTIVPDGKDFAFSLHIHADRAYPLQFYEMANLSSEYGLRGTYDAWYWANSQFYSMQESEYTAGLHALQDSGWDIGVHAVGYADLNRSQVIYGLDRMTEEFGPPRTWSDHGSRPQDLFKEGTDPDSGYYDADLVEEIGAAWMHKNSKAHSFYNDLNRDGMSYTDPDNPDLPLFRVSKMQAWRMYTDPGREDDLDRYLRSWAVDRSVFVTHDYLPYFFYVDNQSGPLSILPDDEGIGYFPWSSLIPKNTFIGEGWSPLPEFERFLNWTTGYDVWFAPVRDIYDRSVLIDQIKVEEDDHQVRITNPTDQKLSGLTLYVKGQPQYHLDKIGTDIGPGRGASGTWHFVVDLEPGSEVVLTKHYDEVNTIDGKVALHMIENSIIARDEEFPIIQVRDR